MAQDKEKARAAGCNDFASKPVGSERLMVEIHECPPTEEVS